MPSIIQKLQDIEARAQEQGHTHDNIVADFAHEIAYLIEQNLADGVRARKSDVYVVLETARRNIRTSLLETLEEAEASFIEELKK